MYCAECGAKNPNNFQTCSSCGELRVQPDKYGTDNASDPTDAIEVGTSTAEELIKEAVEHREGGRIDEAIIAARRATLKGPANANCWWQLALATTDKAGNRAALPYLKKTMEFAPSFAYGWQRLGHAFKESKQPDQAVDCWQKAIEIDPERIDSLEALLNAYRERDKSEDEDKIFEVLKLIAIQDRLATDDINRLGIAYHKRKDYYKSIIYFRRYASQSSGPVGLFNLGLAYSAPEIGQDSDAVDAWRRALLRDSNYDKARTSINHALKPLLDLRNRVQGNVQPLIAENQWYANYINPYELLALGDVAPWDLDARQIQKAKKLLLQEIDLEDGTVEWVPGLKLDRSMALKVSDELNDEQNRYWHHLVFSDTPLLAFLSRGSLDHFLVHQETSPTEVLDALDEDEDFRGWLSKRFAPQYDLLLTEALRRRDINSIECLLDGRRWVVPEDEDRCFDGAHRQVDELLLPLKEAAGHSEQIKPSLNELTKLLVQGHAGSILTLLPITFQREKNDAVTQIRSIAVDAYNHHDDADVAKEILGLARDFTQRSPSLRHRLDEDVDTLNERIAAACKDEASLTLSGHEYSIKREGVRFSSIFIPAHEIASIRWGISVARNGAQETYTFSMHVGARGATAAQLTWNSIKNHETQEDLFNKFVNAAFAYVLPDIIRRISAELDRGSTLRIGPASVNKDGILFTVKGWFSSKTELCPWHRLSSQISNGQLLISDSSNAKAEISMPLRETDNAFALFLMIKKQS